MAAMTKCANHLYTVKICKQWYIKLENIKASMNELEIQPEADSLLIGYFILFLESCGDNKRKLKIL